MDELISALAKTFEDFMLSTGEKHSLKQLLRGIKDDKEKLYCARNRAFDIVSAHIQNSATHHVESVKWLEHVVKIVEGIALADASAHVSVQFSPGPDCAQHIINHISTAQRHVDVCVFTISDDAISDALITAHRRGVAVRIITDDDKTGDSGSDIYRLRKMGIIIKIDNNPSHMHHKFALFDGRTVVNGSFNWTRSASKYNHEDITITTHPSAVAAYSERFETLWEKFKVY